jgi:hypothetical protein
MEQLASSELIGSETPEGFYIVSSKEWGKAVLPRFKILPEDFQENYL